MTSADPDFLRIIRVLARHDVDFIIVGGVAAVLQGVPVTTADLDIVHHRAADNVDRLLAALDELCAYSRLDPRRLRPGVSHLLSAGHQLLTTDAGLLDVLGEISGGHDYETLLADAGTIDIEGRAVRVISLEQLIETKSRAGRPKDAAALPLIRHTLEERNRRP